MLGLCFSNKSCRVNNLFEKLSSGKIHRETYRPFGQFYTLREPESEVDKGVMNVLSMGEYFKSKKNDETQYYLGLVSDPRSFLSVIPDNIGDIAYGVIRDHGLEEALKTMDIVIKQANA